MKINIDNLNHSLYINKEENLGLFDEKNKVQKTSFSSLLLESLNKVNQYESEANDYSIKLASGQLENIHEAMVALQKADISLQFTMQVRNKILDAYREIMRMQI